MKRSRIADRFELRFILSLFTFSLCLLSGDRLHAQIDTAAYWNTLPRPAGGWNSLQRRIIFPELAQRAGLHEAYLATIAVDSSGTVTNVSITGFDGKPVTQTIFILPLTDPIKTIRWIPGAVDGKSVNSSVTVPIIFSTRTSSMGPAILLAAVDPRLKKNYRGTEWHWTRTSDGGCTAAINHGELRIGHPPTYYCDTSFSSDYPERSYDIREAKWTWNSQFLIVSLSRNWSSEHPILVDVYSRRTNRIYSLDALIGPVASPHIRLIGDESFELHLKPAKGCNDSLCTFDVGDLIPSRNR